VLVGNRHHVSLIDEEAFRQYLSSRRQRAAAAKVIFTVFSWSARS
jgi:hypothetical protein